MIFFFGYDKNTKDPKNFTGLFDFNDEIHAQLDEMHYGFRAQNSQVLDWLSTLSSDDMTEFKYKLSDE